MASTLKNLPLYLDSIDSLLRHARACSEYGNLAGVHTCCLGIKQRASECVGIIDGSRCPGVWADGFGAEDVTMNCQRCGVNFVEHAH